MKNYVPGWTALSEMPPVLVKEYSFGAGQANALAVGLPGDKWLLMSPPPKLSAEEVAAFSAHGPVLAAVANNGLHHLGLGACVDNFPGLITYAAPRAAARIRKKGKNFGQLAPVAELAGLLGDSITVTEVAGDKIGDVNVHVRSERGGIFYAGDFFANMQQLPPNFVARQIFKLSGSAPGLKVFKLFFSFFVKDPKAARSALIEEIRTHQPRVLVPAHGSVAEQPDLAPKLIQLLEACA